MSNLSYLIMVAVCASQGHPHNPRNRLFLMSPLEGTTACWVICHRRRVESAVPHGVLLSG